MVKRRTTTKSVSGTKAQQGEGRVKKTKRGTRKLTLHERRSAAAKKGWETRRAKQAALKSLDEKKRRSAKARVKVEPTKRQLELARASKAAKQRREAAKRRREAAAAKQAEVARRRSEASKKGWATRKAKELARRKEAQLDIRAPLLERKDLRPSLPEKFEKLKVDSEQTLEETRKKLVKEDKAKLRSLSFLDLLNEIKSPRLRLEAEYSGSHEAALKIAFKDLNLYWDVQIDKTRRRQQLSRDATLIHFNKHIYGTEMEAYNMVDDTFRVLCTQYGAEETEESKLRKFLSEAYATPQFDAIMTVKAGDLGCSTRDLYSWFNGSPNADFFV